MRWVSGWGVYVEVGTAGLGLVGFRQIDWIDEMEEVDFEVVLLLLPFFVFFFSSSVYLWVGGWGGREGRKVGRRERDSDDTFTTLVIPKELGSVFEDGSFICNW
jgi:hypothetical protein